MFYKQRVVLKQYCCDLMISGINSILVFIILVLRLNHHNIQTLKFKSFIDMYYIYLYDTILHGIIKRQSNFHTTFLIWVKDPSLRPNDHFMLFSFTQPTQVIIILLNYSLWHSFYMETKNTVITKFSTWCCIVKETKRKKEKVFWSLCFLYFSYNNNYYYSTYFLWSHSTLRSQFCPFFVNLLDHQMYRPI